MEFGGSSTQEAESGQVNLSSRLTWSTDLVLEFPGLHRETKQNQERIELHFMH